MNGTRKQPKRGGPKTDDNAKTTETGDRRRQSEILYLDAEPREALPSTQYSNNLYHFARTPKWILEALPCGYLTANYNLENYAFLNIEPVSALQISMVCFCDIPLVPDRIRPHTVHYGGYGIGLTKSWGIRNGVNPVHYITPSSHCARDFQKAFRAAKASNRLGEKNVATLADYLITQLAYFKPLQDDETCYEDECEWRFVPEKTGDWEPILDALSDEEIEPYRKAQAHEKTVRLHFGYDDLTHLLVPDEAGVAFFLDAINGLEVDEGTRDMLKTKIRIVGDDNTW